MRFVGTFDLLGQFFPDEELDWVSVQDIAGHDQLHRPARQAVLILGVIPEGAIAGFDASAACLGDTGQRSRD
jgi:hypothetical protein